MFGPAIFLLGGTFASLALNAWHRCWRKVACAAIAPFLASGLSKAVLCFGLTPDRIHWLWTRSHWQAEVAKLERSGAEPVIALFKWGETGGAAVSNVFETLFYDEGDEIILPRDQWSEAWRARAGRLCPGTLLCGVLKQQGDLSRVFVDRLEGHYYLVVEYY